MIFRLTKKAEQDVIDLYVRGMAEFGVEQAERYHGDLIAAFQLLADNPRIARERVEFTPPVRLHRHAAHMIAYLIRDDEVLIVRVMSRRQDWERHLV